MWRRKAVHTGRSVRFTWDGFLVSIWIPLALASALLLSIADQPLPRDLFLRHLNGSSPGQLGACITTAAIYCTQKAKTDSFYLQVFKRNNTLQLAKNKEIWPRGPIISKLEYGERSMYYDTLKYFERKEFAP